MEPSARAALAPGTAAGVTEPMMRRLVHNFYAKVRSDPDLGSVFDAAIGDQWDQHLAKLCDFWSSVVLMTGRFHGSPMAAHIRLQRIDALHFERWLALWEETASESCPAPAAELFVAKARMIARSLQLGIGAARGELPIRV